MSRPMTETQELFQLAKTEVRNWSIGRIVDKFSEVLDEFVAIVEDLTDPPVRYKLMLDKLIETLCTRFEIVMRPMHVRHSQYGTDVWGPVVWGFFHYASIMITYMYSQKEINDMLDLPILIFNINHILPCSLCESHYLQIKHSKNMRRALKELSFGNLMTGMQTVHNLVTANIYASRPVPIVRPVFNLIDFAKTYECVEKPEDQTRKTLTYVRNQVDSQPPTHRLLSIFYALSKNISYIHASDLLKSLYEAHPSVDTSAELISIERVMTLNIEKHLIDTNMQVIEYAIGELQRSRPKHLSRLIDNIDDRDLVVLNDKGQTNKDILLLILKDTNPTV